MFTLLSTSYKSCTYGITVRTTNDQKGFSSRFSHFFSLSHSQSLYPPFSLSLTHPHPNLSLHHRLILIRPTLLPPTPPHLSFLLILKHRLLYLSDPCPFSTLTIYYIYPICVCYSFYHSFYLHPNPFPSYSPHSPIPPITSSKPGVE